MGLPPWETSDSQLFALVTGANRYEHELGHLQTQGPQPAALPDSLSLSLSPGRPLDVCAASWTNRLTSGLGFAIASRLIDEFFTSASTSPGKHLILVLCTRSPIKTRFTISRLRAHLRRLVEYSAWAKEQKVRAKERGDGYRWEDQVRRVHLLGAEVDLCDLRSVYKLADQLVNGTVGSPDATTMDGGKLPHGSPGTASYTPDVKQDRWALSQQPGSTGSQRSWGWGLSGLRIPRLDVIILSAGIGGWVGLDWPLAVRTVLFDTVEAVTWPRYKRSSLGALVKNPSGSSDKARQPLLENQESDEPPPLGEVFCSNVFGHYILAHELMPLLSRTASPSSKTSGKVIWVSSIEAVDDKFSIDDIQALESPVPYEASKRLIDVLALTSSLPSAQRVAAPFFDGYKTATSKPEPAGEEATLVKPQVYLTHPGIFASEIMPLPALLVFIYKFVFLFARWMGSPWHPIEPYKAAVAPVWLALTDAEELNDAEGGGLKKAKWGSATDSHGEDRVMKTEVPGWGWNGEVEDALEVQKRKGRKRGALDLTREKREEFEVLGGKCWAQMEELRRQWEDILGVKD